jgi:hypothetical protein
MFDGLLDRWSRMVHDKKWWKMFLHFIADIRVYWGGFVLFGASAYKVKGPDMRKILDVIKPGDVLLRVYRHYIGSILVPGYWSHAAVYVGEIEGKPDRVIHMLGAGVANEDLLTFMRCDGIVILRCNKPELIKPAIVKAKSYLDAGTDYDFGFIRGDTQLYCSELIHQIYGKPPEIQYKKYILPDDLLCNLFDIIYSRKPSDPDYIEKNEKENETPFVMEEKKEEVVASISSEDKTDGNNT